MKPPIVVLGSLNADLVSRSQRLPATGETVTGSEFAVYPGGKGGNQAVAAARLGAEVHMLSAVGADSFGYMLIQSLSDAGVQTAALERGTTSSGVALINTDDTGGNQIVVVPRANAEVTSGYVMRHRRMIETASLLLLQLEISLEAVILAASLACEAGVTVILDPAPAQLLPPQLLQSVTWLTPNELETDTLRNVHGLRDGPKLDTQSLARSLLAIGAKNVVLKRGEHGAAAVNAHGEYVYVPAFPVKVADTTAAGDAFNAGFAVALYQGKDSTEAMRFATAVAAISVTRWGAQPSMPTLEEVETFLKAHSSG